MTTKLISMNIGVILELEVDGQERKVQYTMLCPSGAYNHPSEMLQSICTVLNDAFGTNYHIQKHERYPKKEIKIARPKKIKATRPLSQKIFNKRKELGFE